MAVVEADQAAAGNHTIRRARSLLIDRVKSGFCSLAPGTNRVLWRFLAVLIVVYIAKQILLVVIFPPFSGHDEVAHFAYVQTVVRDHRVPELLVDDIPSYFYRYCQFILDWSPCEPENDRWLQQPFRFADWGAAGVFPAGEQYAANHPPLYYLLVAPAFKITETASIETQQYVLRALSIPFGIIAVFFAFATAMVIFPGDRFMAILVSSFVAFQPQVSYEASMVNNDIAGIASMTVVIYLIVRGMKRGFGLFECVALGMGLGVALLIKGNSVVIMPVIALAMILTIGFRRVGKWAARGAIVAGVAAVVTAPWYAFLWRTYGNLDGLAQVEELQQPWNRQAGTFAELLFNRSFVWARWQETWGAFGWRRIQLSPTLLWSIAIPVLLALVGLAIFVIVAVLARRRDGHWWTPSGFVTPDRFQSLALIILLLIVIISYVAVIQFGTRFILTQARYLFPVVTAVAILLTLGLRTIVPLRARPAVQGLAIASLVLLNILIYTKWVVPYWYLTDWPAT
ncbi:glycosyltransferase family 39 protein [soil metagenome]